MPLPVAVAAGLIAGGSQLLGSGINAFSQGQMNKKTRQWNEKMYGIQRRDALADWAMQNEYNSPTSQMARLRQAGLNPNLVYGSGVEGNAASGVRSTEVKSWNPETPRIDLGGSVGNALAAYYDVKMKEAQFDNLTTQNTVMQNDAMLKTAQTIATYINAKKGEKDTQLKDIEIRQKESLFDIVIAQAIANLNSTDARTQFTLDENQRQAIKTSQSIQESVQRILTMKKQRAKTDAEIRQIDQYIKNLEKDERLKQLDIELKQLGIQPGDKIYERIIGRLINERANTIEPINAPATMGTGLLQQGARSRMGSGIKKR